MVDLMAATGARSDNDGSVRLAADGMSQWFGDFQREFVFGGEGAECAGHAATASIEQRCLSGVKTFGKPFHESYVHEGFGVAMGVDDDVGRFCIEGESVWITAQ